MTRLATWWTLLPVTAPMPPPSPPGSERGEEFGKTSPLALVVILLLGLATVLLIRSMTKRLRNVPASFDPPERRDADDRPDGEGPDADGTNGKGPNGGGRDAPDGHAEVDRTERPPGTGSP